MAQNNDLFGDSRKTPASSKSHSEATGKNAPPAKPQRSGVVEADYNADSIQVLEGLEAVRRHPGMYIGGTDETALHHLFAEVIDNSMDEAVAGHATFIEVELEADGFLSVSDNGRGVPIDMHKKYKNKSALEVIMTTLHSGSKFVNGAYETSGGLHGVGVSAVNALSDHLEVEVAREQTLYRLKFSRGLPLTKLEKVGRVHNRRGTKVRFHPDPEIFGKSAHFKPARLFRMARSKAYLFGGVEIRWKCAPSLVEGTDVPAQAVFRFPGGLRDYLSREIEGKDTVVAEAFVGKIDRNDGQGTVEWAISWLADEDGFIHSYCNTIPTPDGGTHEAGFRAALLKGLKDHAERINQAKRAQNITGDDISGQSAALISVFIRKPEFQSQNKSRLISQEAARLVEQNVRDAFDHWLAGSPQQAAKLLDFVVERAEDRLRRRQEKDVQRKTAVKKLRLPGKLADCSNAGAKGSELYIVEGDSAGGSAKQARDRATQAVLPLRGKILNVASATREKLSANQQIGDLTTALGCGAGGQYRSQDLRYERVIIMTDADVDGAHIASLLITYFYRQMPKLIEEGHLFIAAPPLFKITQGAKSFYARDEAERDKIIAKEFSGKGKIEISRFKGLGEMNADQLKTTTMDPRKRMLLRVCVGEDERNETSEAVERLMGNKAEARFQFIQERAAFSTDIVDL